MERSYVWTPSTREASPPGNPFRKKEKEAATLRVVQKTNSQDVNDSRMPKAEYVSMPPEFKQEIKKLIEKMAMPKEYSAFQGRRFTGREYVGPADEEWFRKNQSRIASLV